MSRCKLDTLVSDQHADQEKASPTPCPRVPPGLACPGSERQLVNFIRVVSRVQLSDLPRPRAAGAGISIVLSIRATSENIPSVYSWRLL